MTAVMTQGLVGAVLQPESVLRTMLANGLRVLVRRDTSAPVVAIVTYVKAGYFDEPDDVVGIAHVLEHMYFKGTPTRGVGEIARETKASGGYLNAGTIYDHTHYYTVLPSDNLAAGLAVQADAYANSLIDAAELSRELEVIIEEAKRKQDTPSALATESLFALLHDHHRIRRWRIGHEAGLRTLTRDKVAEFYRNYYCPSNTVLAIVGDIVPEQALRLVKQYYGGLPDARVQRVNGPAEPAREDTTPRYFELEGDVQQSELVFGWRTPALLHEDTPALDLLGAVLANGRASRLYRAVRERRLASAITASNYTPDQLGVFVVHATVRPERARSAARTIWDQVRRARDGEITEIEVERARRVLEANWLRRFETMEGQASHLATWETLGDWRLGNEYVDQLLMTDAARVTDVAKRYLAPERAGLITYRPSSAPVFAADDLALHGVLEGDAPGADRSAHAAGPADAAPRRTGVGVRARGGRCPRLPDIDGHSRAGAAAVRRHRASRMVRARRRVRRGARRGGAHHARDTHVAQGNGTPARAAHRRGRGVSRRRAQRGRVGRQFSVDDLGPHPPAGARVRTARRRRAASGISGGRAGVGARGGARQPRVAA